MEITVTVCINSINVPVKATLNLPDQYKYMPFEITSPLELTCNVDLTQPIPYVDNVYLIRGDNFHYKIGFSKTPKKRLNELQTGNPHPLELIACCPGAKPLEDLLHDMFTEVRKEAGSAQEWFVLDEEQVDTIKHIMAVKYYTYKFSENILNDLIRTNPHTKSKASLVEKLANEKEINIKSKIDEKQINKNDSDTKFKINEKECELTTKQFNDKEQVDTSFPYAEFIAETCDHHPDYKIRANELYEEYRRFMSGKCEDRKRFYAGLRNKYVIKTSTGKVNYVFGLRLKSQDDQTEVLTSQLVERTAPVNLSHPPGTITL